jgi:hypothetical protein
LNDPKQRTHVSYGVSTPSLYLIRPDGYVGFRGHVGDEAELINYLQRHYSILAPARVLRSAGSSTAV